MHQIYLTIAISSLTFPCRACQRLDDHVGLAWRGDSDRASRLVAVIPGMGGSQRLTRFVGKSKAMEMCLTGRIMDAQEALQSGLVSRIVPAPELVGEALRTAETIAAFSLPAVTMAKEAVNRSYDLTASAASQAERGTMRDRQFPTRPPKGRELLPVCTENLNTGVVVMKSAQDGA